MDFAREVEIESEKEGERECILFEIYQITLHAADRQRQRQRLKREWKCILVHSRSVLGGLREGGGGPGAGDTGPQTQDDRRQRWGRGQVLQRRDSRYLAVHYIVSNVSKECHNVNRSEGCADDFNVTQLALVLMGYFLRHFRFIVSRILIFGNSL